MLQVTCALLLQAGKTFAAQRSATMSNPLKWEFPGGKLEPGEAPADCIVRELQEEFAIEVKPLFPAPAFPFPASGTPNLTLLPFVCKLVQGQPVPAEHAEFRWLDLKQLEQLDWAAADLPVLAWWKANFHRF